MNKLLNYQNIQSITQGVWITRPGNPDEILKGGAFDTRKLGTAQIFFAWEGENSDGHHYLNQLQDSSIKLIVAEKDVKPVADKPIIKVKDSLQALHKIAGELISDFPGKVVNITGSSGKTTTKEWLRHIVKNQRRFLTNVGSFNNHIGCPITILNLDEEHEVLALEMGTSGLGELATLTRIAPADIAVLLNVGHAHVGKFGGLDKTYQAKLEIFSQMRQNAIALVPYGDDEISQRFDSDRCHFFGKGSPLFSWECLDIDPLNLRQTLQFSSPYGSKTVVVNKLGEYVGDLLSAILAVCYYLGLGWEEIEPGLSSLPAEKGRSVFGKGINGVTILDDTYNANPESVIQMLKTLCMYPSERRIGVVGNLAELEEGLKESAGFILDHLPEQLTELILGGDTGKILVELIRRKKPHLKTCYFESWSAMFEYLKPMGNKQTIIGVKGSRSSHMERLVHALSGKPVSCNLEHCGKLCSCLQCEELFKD